MEYVFTVVECNCASQRKRKWHTIEQSSDLINHDLENDEELEPDDDGTTCHEEKDHDDGGDHHDEPSHSSIGRGDDNVDNQGIPPSNDVHSKSNSHSPRPPPRRDVANSSQQQVVLDIHGDNINEVQQDPNADDTRQLLPAGSYDSEGSDS